jgi:hypothetical protein
MEVMKSSKQNDTYDSKSPISCLVVDEVYNGIARIHVEKKNIVDIEVEEIMDNICV